MIWRKLESGDVVGVVAPASSVTSERIRNGVTWLESLGYTVRLGETVGEQDRFLGGADADRARDLGAMFADDEVRAIFTARGGYGSSRILDAVDYTNIRDHPKPFVGFCDTTAFQLGLYARTGVPSLSGFVLATDAAEGPPSSDMASDVFGALEGVFPDIDGLEGEDMEGTLVGGCLTLITHLIGTRYLPDLAGCLLFLEDVGEAPYRIDRLLTQLLLANVLKAAAGVVVGAFHKCDGDGEDGTVEDVIDDFRGRCPCPVITGLPYGHGPSRRVMPIGVHAQVLNGTITFRGRGVDGVV